MSQMDIENIRKLVKNSHYRITLHAQKRMDQRGVTLEELKEVIYHENIVEKYSNDTPFPSCLILGSVRGGFPLYVVCGVEKKIHIITVHWLDPEKWLDTKTRREKK